MARCFVFAAALLLLVSSAVVAAEGPQRPNMVVILADDLGSHDVGWRGSEIKTPHLDALAQRGARLNQFYVQPVCSPTRAALLTGRYPLRYGFQTGVVRPWAQYGLPLEERTLPQALHDAGYETAIVGKWHLGHFRPEYLPTRRGFDHQYGHYNGALDYYTHIRDGGFDWHRNDQENHDEGYATHLIASEAERRIQQRNREKPLFLYVPFNGVHAPLQVPEEYLKAYPQFSGNRRVYAGMVTALDEAVGKIVAALKQEGLLENTLIVFSSDNGGPNPGKLTDNGPLRAGKGTVYEGGVRVCAFATWEGKIKPGDVETPIHITDLYPTLLRIAGAKTEQSLPLDGHDVWPVLTRQGESPRKSLVINAGSNANAIRVGNWKLVLKEKGTADEVTELFDLEKDPGEKNNVAGAHPEVVKDLQEQLAHYISQAIPAKTRPAGKNFKAPRVWGEQGN
jgi:arylsulfatase A-like enzyme